MCLASVTKNDTLILEAMVLVLSLSFKDQPKAVFPPSQFLSRIINLLDQGQIIFSNIINIVLEKLKNLWKYDF